MNITLARDLIHPELFRIHLIKCTQGAGATTLLKTMDKASDKQFHMDDDFSVCVLKQENENIHLQVWDDNELVREHTSYKGTDVELFLVDTTDENNFNATFNTLQNHTTLNPARTLRILVATKADRLDADELEESDAILKKLGAQFNFDQYTLINSTSIPNVRDLLDDITQSAILMRNYFKNEQTLRREIIAKIDDKILELANSGWFLTNKALNLAKKAGLTQLKNALLEKPDVSIKDIITDIRSRYPKVDEGHASQNTKLMLDSFIKDSEAIPTTRPVQAEVKSDAGTLSSDAPTNRP